MFRGCSIPITFYSPVIGNSFFFVINIYMACRVNKFNLMADKAVRNCIRMFVFIDLDIPVFHHRYFFKYPDLITLISKWHKGLLFLQFKKFAPAFGTLLKALPVVDNK